jgi:Arc/MetJ-type ribon-helix-helix transcriptional regulator
VEEEMPKSINVRLDPKDNERLLALMEAEERSNASDLVRVLIRRAFLALFIDQNSKVSITEAGKQALHIDKKP